MPSPKFLLERARAHFSDAEVDDEICGEAATQLLKDREDAPRHGLARPGAAEFLDILRALSGLHCGDTVKQREALARIQGFALRKNPAEERF